METLVATVLIVVLFTVASLILNNVFASTITRNDSLVQQELKELQYLHQHNKINLPYYNKIGSWEIEAVQIREFSEVVFRATHIETQKEISVTSIN